ncbi:CbtA family protein [Litorisediminicola beolgyonensis]|uniref:CbtA family protein n=1 Tax=Litorisediminicola beolgyonensis TaxID=1173614 RepID=A0ABW3ZGM4_9RHOB
MLSRLLTGALLAGAAAGLVAAVLQLVLLQPLLIEAEAYEIASIPAAGGEAHGHGATEIAAGIDLARNGLTILFSILIYAGYALILTALMALAESRGHAVTARAGLLWGAAGFVAVQLAPAVSLGVALPGGAAADIAMRQVWWIACVAATGLGLWCLAFGASARAWGAAIVLVLGPHLIGAPQPESYWSAAPAELASVFAPRALGIGLFAWMVTGALAGYLRTRSETAAETRAA